MGDGRFGTAQPVRRCRFARIFGHGRTPKLGGGGSDDFRFNVVLAEELAAAGIGGAGLGLTLHNDITTPYFLTYCDEDQRNRWLPGIASGELITAVAMTEPGIGSDLAR